MKEERDYMKNEFFSHEEQALIKDYIESENISFTPAEIYRALNGDMNYHPDKALSDSITMLLAAAELSARVTGKEATYGQV
jgi:hypothetical protein